MAEQLNADNLKEIKQILMDPMLENINAGRSRMIDAFNRQHDEMLAELKRCGTERCSQIDTLHRRVDANEQRTEKNEASIAGMERFKFKVVTVYGIITAVALAIWGLIHPLLAVWFKKKVSP
jgi:hypothetical protein